MKRATTSNKPKPGNTVRGKITFLKFFISLLVWGISLSGFSQSRDEGTISGKVIDAGDRGPIPAASIRIFGQNTATPLKGLITDSNGNFSVIELPDNEYQIIIDFVGYKSDTINHIKLFGSKTKASLGNIVLFSVQHQLNAVSITAKAPVIENKIDRLVYNAASDITSQGGAALDVLKNAPMVSVDIDGNVELQGNGNIRFLINGKPSTILGKSITDALQAIPASQVKSIEVITSPGAKYDAAGTAGVINIILKDNKLLGVNGSMSLSAGTHLENGSANLTARTKNMGISAFFSGNEQLKAVVINTSNRRSYNQTRDTIDRFYQDRHSPIERDGFQSGLNFDWNLGPKDVLTAGIMVNHTAFNGTGLTPQDEQTLLASGDVLYDIFTLRHTIAKTRNTSADWSLSYKKEYKKEGQELNILYSSSYLKQYEYSSQFTTYTNTSNPTFGAIAENPGSDHETDISADYTVPFAKGFTLETGAKAVLENINSTVKTDTLAVGGNYLNDPGQSFNFKFNRNIYAAYLSSSFSFFKGLINGSTGLRYERTETTIPSGIRIPGNSIWAPSFLVQYKLGETQALGLAYSYRIQRPDYEDLNPFIDIIDPHNINTGNPQLKTEIGQKYELSYHNSFAQDANFYLNIYYNNNTNDIQPFVTFYPLYVANGINYANVSLSTPQNIGSQKTYGSNLLGSMPLTNKLNLRADLTLREIINNVPGSPAVRGFSYRFNLNTTYRFANSLAAEAFVNYNSARINFQNVAPAFLVYTFAVKKEFSAKKMSIGLTTTDPFNRITVLNSSASGNNFNQSTRRLQPNRSFGLTFSYKFGKLELKNVEGAKEKPADMP